MIVFSLLLFVFFTFVFCLFTIKRPLLCSHKTLCDIENVGPPHHCACVCHSSTPSWMTSTHTGSPSSRIYYDRDGKQTVHANLGLVHWEHWSHQTTCKNGDSIVIPATGGETDDCIVKPVGVVKPRRLYTKTNETV